MIKSKNQKEKIQMKYKAQKQKYFSLMSKQKEKNNLKNSLFKRRNKETDKYWLI